MKIDDLSAFGTSRWRVGTVWRARESDGKGKARPSGACSGLE
jgi:hypothetical protein